MKDKTINFSFTVEQTNALLTALGQLPYAQAHMLIEMIMVQGHEQAMAIMKAQSEIIDEDSQAPANPAA